MVPVEKNLSCGEICPHDRFSCGQILHITDCHVDKFLTWQIVMWKKFSTWEMWRKFVMWRNNVYNLWCFVAFYAVLLQNRDLRRFVAISVLSQFTRFCVEKNLAKNGPGGEKGTNIRYASLLRDSPPTWRTVGSSRGGGCYQNISRFFLLENMRFAESKI